MSKKKGFGVATIFPILGRRLYRPLLRSRRQSVFSGHLSTVSRSDRMSG